MEKAINGELQGEMEKLKDENKNIAIVFRKLHIHTFDLQERNIKLKRELKEAHTSGMT